VYIASPIKAIWVRRCVTVVQGHSRSFKVIKIGTNRPASIRNFLLLLLLQMFTLQLQGHITKFTSKTVAQLNADVRRRFERTAQGSRMADGKGVFHCKKYMTCSNVPSFTRHNDLLVKNLRFCRFYRPKSQFEALARDLGMTVGF